MKKSVMPTRGFSEVLDQCITAYSEDGLKSRDDLEDAISALIDAYEGETFWGREKERFPDTTDQLISPLRNFPDRGKKSCRFGMSSLLHHDPGNLIALLDALGGERRIERLSELESDLCKIYGALRKQAPPAKRLRGRKRTTGALLDFARGSRSNFGKQPPSNSLLKIGIRMRRRVFVRRSLHRQNSYTILLSMLIAMHCDHCKITQQIVRERRTVTWLKAGFNDLR